MHLPPLPIHIATSRPKLVKLTASCLMFVAIAVLFLVKPHWFDAHLYVVWGVAVVALLFFGLCLVVLIKVWRYQGSYLVINDKGVLDNGVSGIGQVLWCDMTGVDLTNEYGVPLILIRVANPDKYISQAPKWRQWLHRYNHERYGTPVVISVVAMAVDGDELYALLDAIYHSKRL